MCGGRDLRFVCFDADVEWDAINKCAQFLVAGNNITFCSSNCKNVLSDAFSFLLGRAYRVSDIIAFYVV